jgi:uncharacterized protein
VTLLYNLVMLAVDVAAVRWVIRREGLLVWCGTMACVGAFALALAGFLGGCFEDHFGFFRLWAYGVCLHTPGLLLVTAVLWRRSRPLLAGGALVAAMAVLLAAADALLVEPHWLEVSHWQIASPKIHRAVRIVVVADLQAGRIGPYERSVLRQALAEKPDLILLAGDYIQPSAKELPALRSELHDFLREINFTAPLGVFAVQGNVEAYVAKNGWPKTFTGLKVTTVDATRSFDLGDLKLTCLALSESHKTKLRIPRDQPDRFHLVLGHMPDFALGQIEADLLVAGHTHGGQVCMPLIGAVITGCEVPRVYAAGLHELPNGARLLVSRGIGMERGYAPPMRFLCRPELMVIDLIPEAKGTTHEHR